MVGTGVGYVYFGYESTMRKEVEKLKIYNITYKRRYLLTSLVGAGEGGSVG